MIRLAERAGERLLALFLPKATAKAVCWPFWYCEWCTGGKTRWVYHAPDCSNQPNPCATNECQP